VIGRQTDRSAHPIANGWASAPRRRGASWRRIGAFVLLLPLVFGLLGSPAMAPPARGDELADARAKAAAMKKKIAEEKAQVAQLNALQAGLAADIASTRRQLAGINADLSAVKKKISRMTNRIKVVQHTYDDLVVQLAALDVELTGLMAQEQAKRVQLAARKALLADRIRSAYDTNRTSMLESFLSSGSFSDLLAEMSYYIDVGEQDKALAQQVVRDQEELAARHEIVVATQERTDDLRLATAAQKRALNKSLKGLKDAKAELRRLEKETQRNLAIQRATYAKVAVNKKNAAKALAAAARAQKVLAGRIADIVRRQSQQGNIPSQYNGTLRWPMSGNVTQPFGCTGFSWEPPLGSCAHFHQGIDIVAPYGTPVRASGDGVIAYIGWNYADGADPAWIVIIAHSSGLQTWYAHMKAAYPGNIHQGSQVRAGQIIGHEGNTGHSTGAHLHWAVMLNGDFVNPRLFL
jgi:murein DD-endopeptidase MepM/ murein hydrolase activator NlpD